jgi:hypothetical protein
MTTTTKDTPIASALFDEVTETMLQYACIGLKVTTNSGDGSAAPRALVVAAVSHAALVILLAEMAGASADDIMASARALTSCMDTGEKAPSSMAFDAGRAMHRINGEIKTFVAEMNAIRGPRA